jgi:hypothetical protein
MSNDQSPYKYVVQIHWPRLVKGCLARYIQRVTDGCEPQFQTGIGHQAVRKCDPLPSQLRQIVFYKKYIHEAQH